MKPLITGLIMFKKFLKMLFPLLRLPENICGQVTLRSAAPRCVNECVNMCAWCCVMKCCPIPSVFPPYPSIPRIDPPIDPLQTCVKLTEDEPTRNKKAKSLLDIYFYLSMIHLMIICTRLLLLYMYSLEI